MQCLGQAAAALIRQFAKKSLYSVLVSSPYLLVATVVTGVWISIDGYMLTLCSWPINIDELNWVPWSRDSTMSMSMSIYTHHLALLFCIQKQSCHVWTCNCTIKNIVARSNNTWLNAHLCKPLVVIHVLCLATIQLNDIVQREAVSACVLFVCGGKKGRCQKVVGH
jgi:hypothetical protein